MTSNSSNRESKSHLFTQEVFLELVRVLLPDMNDIVHGKWSLLRQKRPGIEVTDLSPLRYPKA